MGDIAEAMLEGDMCQSCGEWLGEGEGYAVSCAGCGEAGEDDALVVDWFDIPLGDDARGSSAPGGSIADVEDERLVALVVSGLTHAAIGEHFGVGARTIKRRLARHRKRIASGAHTASGASDLALALSRAEQALGAALEREDWPAVEAVRRTLLDTLRNRR